MCSQGGEACQVSDYPLSLRLAKKIFEINLRNRPIEKSVALATLADLTKGYASSEIVDICDGAAKIPLREVTYARM